METINCAILADDFLGYKTGATMYFLGDSLFFGLIVENNENVGYFMSADNPKINGFSKISKMSDIKFSAIYKLIVSGNLKVKKSQFELLIS